ncbi:hypothetical protein K7432_011305 [Basidiobolus ranarum]|uniref:Uncharacterized protein n=1 Tax=Basidiobolus ranarum TaxID=34480 RepID=A0ABR2VU63_9FUNG
MFHQSHDHSAKHTEAERGYKEPNDPKDIRKHRTTLMQRFIVLLFALLALSHMVLSADSRDRNHRNSFTPRNYPGLIINVHGQNAICYHGDLIFLARTAFECPQDIGCYAIDKDSSKIRKVLKTLKRNGNLVWPRSPGGGPFSRRIDPKNSDLKDWPGKGKRATCRGD